MRSNRARRRSWRWFPVFYLSKLIPESSEFPVPICWKAHPKTLRTSVFLFLSPEISFADPHKTKTAGSFNGGDGRWSRQYWCSGSRQLQSEQPSLPNISTVQYLPVKFPWFFPLWGSAKGTSVLGKSRNIQGLLADRIHRRYGMRAPCDSEESVRKTKDLMSDVKAWDESARTQWVFISGLAFNQISDPLFFSDSGVEQGSRITYLRPVLSRKFWIFSGIS